MMNDIRVCHVDCAVWKPRTLGVLRIRWMVGHMTFAG